MSWENSQKPRLWQLSNCPTTAWHGSDFISCLLRSPCPKMYMFCRTSKYIWPSMHFTQLLHTGRLKYTMLQIVHISLIEMLSLMEVVHIFSITWLIYNVTSGCVFGSASLTSPLQLQTGIAIPCTSLLDWNGFSTCLRFNPSLNWFGGIHIKTTSRVAKVSTHPLVTSNDRLWCCDASASFN